MGGGRREERRKEQNRKSKGSGKKKREGILVQLSHCQQTTASECSGKY